MKDRGWWLLALTAFVWMLVTSNVTARAEEQKEVLEVGKKGEIVLASKATLGSLVLEPGRYRFQHRMEGAEHFVRFEKLRPATHYDPYRRGSREPEEVKCQLEPLDSEAKRTEVTTVGGKITKILVRGENFAHTF